MLNLRARAQLGRLVTPVATRLARTGLSPDVVTVVGTLGAVVGAGALLARGDFLPGALVVAAFTLLDLLDGALARARGGQPRPWGAVLDSTMDRISDAAVFGSLVIWFAQGGHSALLAVVALYGLVAGAVVSYVKARAGSLGLSCEVGFAERAERLIIVLVGAGLAGLGVPVVLPAALWILAAVTTWTVGQRLVEVHRQAGLGAT